ncbi:ketoacyl-synt-domain-containing protein [Mollisia scopiformis]|uniref:Ketoacyl-synt-domain-containing protein n=1 Tax=Mollisia scopiformis TaxID=149040 RepID=A0A132BCA0_MOLSC|nr:ketoacyl-synt-domain-containing protein [Mollisia scopiformis]KUJ09893.1 ketoacyl-synt-domain-containing protein [Mollisia scopiformis]
MGSQGTQAVHCFPREPIAIVGSSFRFPGGATSPSKLWDLLERPRDVLQEIPESRFSTKTFYHQDGQHHGSMNVKHAYLLDEDPRAFDRDFFSINPKEAEAMDPQQRVLLETVYEGVESAGYSMQQLRGSRTAVLVGCMSYDYHFMAIRGIDSLPRYHATGTAASILANRISYFFDWRGPSATIDTACSSSLVALHQAVSALWNGEVDMAVAAGSNLILGPEPFVSESKLNMLSPNGRSFMWDASADGYTRGEGFCAVFLKTLSRALADGDHIESIVRETGVNSDGKTPGITMPSSESQAQLILDTYARCGLDPTLESDRPQYFEAHGTGTPAGDPIEARAIQTVFFPDGETGRLMVGSIKTVIGHTEGTAGVAGVLKVSLAVQHGVIPANLHFKNLNPKIRPYYTNLQIPSSTTPWPPVSQGSPRRVSVNSFGFGGTNAHAIIESWDSHGVLSNGHTAGNQALTSVPANGPFPTYNAGPFLLSASSGQALASSAEAMISYLRANPDVNLDRLGYSLMKRTAFPFRVAFSATSTEKLADKIEASKDSLQNASRAMAIPETLPLRILGVFTGQGAQWATMGAELYGASDVFRRAIDKMQQSLDSLPAEDRPNWSLVDQLQAAPASSRVGEAAISQPLCTALQVALVDTLHAASIHFDAVIGHSSGEIAAAYAAGYLNAFDAIRVAHYRGVHSVLAQGEFGEALAVAASNSQTSCTIAGDAEAIEEAFARLQERGIFARMLQSCANPYLDSMRRCRVKLQKGYKQCRWYSSVWGSDGRSRSFDQADGRLLEGPYWLDNMTQTVLFSQALTRALSEDQCFDAILEVEPHPALKGPCSETIKMLTGLSIPYSGLLKRGESAVESLADAMGFLWKSFASQREILLAAAGYLSMAYEAVIRLVDDQQQVRLVELHDLDIVRAMRVQEDSSGLEVVFTLRVTTQTNDCISAELSCYTGAVDAVQPLGVPQTDMTVHFTGRARLWLGQPMEDVLPFRKQPVLTMETLDMGHLYSNLSKEGFNYTDLFQAKAMRRRLNSAVVTLSSPPEHTQIRNSMHPAPLDTAFHGLFAGFSYPGDGRIGSIYLPTRVDYVRISMMQSESQDPVLKADATVTSTDKNIVVGDLDLFDAATLRTEVQLRGVHLTPVGNHRDPWLYASPTWIRDAEYGIPPSKAVKISDAELVLYEQLTRTAYFYLRRLRKMILKQELLIMSKYRKHMMTWILDHLLPQIEAGEHPEIRPEWKDDTLEMVQEWRASQPADNNDMNILHAMGKNLVSVVRGITQPLKVLMQDSLLDRLYVEGIGFKHGNADLGTLVKQLTHRQPRMRMVEVGAGTGGTTRTVLDAIGNHYLSYTYTDISTGFFENARTVFSQHSGKLNFKTLNIENSPEDQGFTTGSYDMVISSNCLHATRRLEETLRNCRQLLRPGGKLVLIEITRDFLPLQLIMSTLSGWFFGIKDGRVWAPTVNLQRWDELLRATGFSGVDVSSTPSFASVIMAEEVDQTFQLIRDPFSISLEAIPAMGDIIIVGGGASTKLPSHVQAVLLAAVPSKTVTLHPGLEGIHVPKGAVVLSLCDLDCPVFRDMDEKRFKGLQNVMEIADAVLWVSSSARRGENPDKTYLLCGMTGDLGISVCLWMIENGARNMVLTSRNPNVSPDVLDYMSSKGALVRPMAVDITNMDSLRAAYADIKSNMPRIGGVMNAAMVLRDRFFHHMSWDDFAAVFAPKVAGSKNLDDMFGTEPLDFFICFSSTTSIVGSFGQSAYAAANHYMARLIKSRLRRGLAGSVIHISILTGFGYIFRRDAEHADTIHKAILPRMERQSETDLHEMLAEAIVCGRPGSGQPSELITGIRTVFQEDWREDPRLSCYMGQQKLEDDSDRGQAGNTISVKEQLTGAENPAECLAVLVKCFLLALGNMLEIDPAHVNSNASVAILGIDSLIAIRIREWFLREIGVDVPVLKVMSDTYSIFRMCDDALVDWRRASKTSK